jgi:hypothetical protein
MARKKSRHRERSANIPRDPYPEVKQRLRQEVHYACPVPGCGSPLLEWHHFDPKWEEKHHHDPEGMIALCTTCHPRADRGAWSKEQLRSFKRNPAPLGVIRATFGWAERSVVYRLGGTYAADNAAGVLAVGGQRVLWEERSAEGRLLFSLDFVGERGRPLLRVRQNCLSVDAAGIHDLSINAGATHLKVWLGENKPGIELRFRRLSLAEVKCVLDEDARRSRERAQRILAESPRATSLGAGGLAGMPPFDYFGYFSENCTDSGGGVTLVDVSRAMFYGANGRLVEVFDDVIRSDTGGEWSHCSAFNNGGYGFNL